MENLAHLSKLNIVASASLSGDDIQSLTLLYQPLIGPEALALYLAFSSLIERNNMKSLEYSHSDIIDMLGINDESFLHAREILEAIGLLNTYYKENDDSYIYILCQPLSPNSFLSDGVLGVYLESKIGVTMYNSLVQRFKISKIDKKDYDNISKNFDEIFDTSITPAKLNKDNYYLVGRKRAKKPTIVNKDFDMELFLKSIDLQFLAIGPTEEFKELIETTAAVYNFDEQNLISLYNQSINGSQSFDTKAFKRKAKMLYNHQHSEGLPNLTIKESENSHIDQIASLTPIQMLAPFHQNEPIPADDLDTIEAIYTGIRLNRAMQNIMIMSVLKNKKGILPKLAYFEVVYNSWMNEGIMTATEAYNKVMKNESAPSRKSKKKTMDMTGEQTAWLEDFKKGLKEEN